MSIRFTQKPEEATVVTHAGNFHADDIFSIVLLEKVFGNLVVYRILSDMKEKDQFKEDVIFFDVGDGKFDHHQKGGNGFHPTYDTALLPIPYAAFGLLWREFGNKICKNLTDSELQANVIAKNFENLLVLSIDANDNGIYPKMNPEYGIHRIISVSNVISTLNSNEDSPEKVAEQLEKAINFARTVFDVVLEYSARLANNSADLSQFPRFNTSDMLAEVFAKKIGKESFTCTSELLKESHSFNSNIPFSAFGKLWENEGKAYCKTICDKGHDYIWFFVKDYLVKGIDACESGISPFRNDEYVEHNVMTIPRFVAFINQIVSKDNYQKTKDLLLEISNLIFDSVVLKGMQRAQSKEYVEAKIKESHRPFDKRNPLQSSRHILILEKHLHWQDWVARSSDAKQIWFVISPSNKGGYVIQPVPCKYTGNGFRKGFPRKWWGLKGEDLQNATKISSATFIYPKNGFIGGAADLSGAVSLAFKSFSHNENKLS